MIKKHIAFFYFLFKLKLSKEMMYSVNFWMTLIIDGLFFLIQLSVFSTIFLQVQSINGWSTYHMCIFIGTFTILDGLYMGTYFFGVQSIGDKIRTGKLDIYITKPINTLFFISFEEISIGSIFIVIPGIIMVAYGAIQLGITLSFLKIAGYLFLLIVMYILMYNLMVLLRCTAFWFTKIDSINQLENELVSFSFKIPGIAFKGLSKIVFYFILPYGLMATIPTQFFTGTLSFGELIIAIGVCTIFTLLTQFTWRIGMKRYGSASS
jgi:ABC-2 type transport system permease protein